MTLLSWFFEKPKVAPVLPAGQAKVPESVQGPSRVPMPQATAAKSPSSQENIRVRRHARREQLYIAIREAMTHSGVLSAGYKFKVLSLDQAGNEFLAMVDLSLSSGKDFFQLAEIETAIVQQARVRFEIIVPTVYWRIDGTLHDGSTPVPVSAAMKNPLAARSGTRDTATSQPAILVERSDGVKPRQLSVSENEVAAFRQALHAASAKASSNALEASPVPRVAPRSYTLLTGFEDTEMFESAAAPALSRTQYGDLR